VQAKNATGQSEIPFYFPGMVSISKQWLEGLGQYAESGKSFDLIYETERSALATMGETLFKNDTSQTGKNPFGLTTDDDELCTRFLESYHTLFELLTRRFLEADQTLFELLTRQLISGLASNPIAGPLFGDKLYSYWYKDEESKFGEEKKTLKEILEPIFKSLLEGEVDKESHLYKMIKYFGINIEKPNYKKILDDSLGFLQASFETSSKALGWVLYHLARDQNLQDKLRRMLSAAFKGGVPETIEDLKKVPLLSQMMEETLRLFPPFPVLLRDIKKPEDFKAFKVEKGGTFLISPYLIHRNAKEWENPTTFDPSRFKTSGSRKDNMLSDAWQIGHDKYATFIGGIHRCPGRHFGKQELLINIALFIMRYKIVLKDQYHNEPVDLKFCITLHPKDPIKVKIIRV